MMLQAQSGSSGQQLCHHVGDSPVHFVDAQLAFDQGHTVGFALGDVAVFLPDATIESILFLFESVFVWAIVFADPLIALAGAGQICSQAAFKVRQQQKGQVRLQVAADEPVQIKDNGRAELASAALVGFGGVGKAVTEHDAPRSQRRFNDLSNRLRPIGKHQRHLGQGGNGRAARIQQQGANAVAGFGSSRLAGQYRLHSSRIQPTGQTLDLSGLTGAVEAFERNQ